MVGPLTDYFLNFLIFILNSLLKSHFPCAATMVRQLSCFIGLYFVCYCMPVSSTGLTIHNSLLHGHAFKTYVSIDWLSRAQECDKEDMCFSYNYFLSSETCELNNPGLKDPCNNADNRLIRSTGWIYHEIDASQVKNIQPFMQLSRVIARVARRKIIFTI